MSVARQSAEDYNSELKRARVEIRPSLSFLDKDKIGTIQPHDDGQARQPAEDCNSELKRARVEIRPSLSFLDKDKIGTNQPHDDALVVTRRIGGYDVKRVMVDQGICAEIMYPDLYRGLNLKPEDLTAYDSSLVNFDGKVVILKGQIRLPV
ncbi:uncharacterized protein LOC136068579 [Quercus suber]|uniref:uncharacterized protein LOC112011329 n=1 Tax=Quercus suber TaxID=58331 RepID=UPI000CE25C20|nr:uncharacterized protein LOC112011329 [Quercus suber]